MSFFKKLTGLGSEKSDTESETAKKAADLAAKEAGARAKTEANGRNGRGAPLATKPGEDGAPVPGANARPDDDATRPGGKMSPKGDARRTGPAGVGGLDPNEAGGRLRTITDQGSNLPNLLPGGSSADMLKMLCDQAGLKFVRLGDYPKSNITPQLLRHIDSEIARSYKVFPVALENGTMTIAISDPLNVRVVDDLTLMLAGNDVSRVEPVVAREEEIVDYINLFYGVGDVSLEEMVTEFEAQDESSGMEGVEGAVDIGDLDKLANEPPIIRFCNLLLLQAIKDRASDLHIEPFSGVIRIRYRVDGALREIQAPPKSWQTGILSRFKVMASLDISESRRPQDGRLKLTVEGREIDCRLSVLPVVHGECLVMRLLDKSMMQVGVAQIGMTQDVLEKFMKIIQRPNGIVLVTGPTGSGKTTSLYAALNEINHPTEKIITTEDPVEYQLDGIVQVSVNPGQGLTFAKALRAILRQDPDVILVGEIRDVETAQIAVQASLTGHLVLSSLHTNSAAATISRLVDMGIEPFLITSCLEGIVAQRLVRMVCGNCWQPYRPTVEELADFGTTEEEVADITFRKGVGCDECGQTGFKGRLGIFELLVVTDEVRNMILERGTTDQLHALCLEQGMKTMRQDGWLKICLGVTTFEEVAKHTPKEDADVIRKEMRGVVQGTVDALGAGGPEVETGRRGPTMAEAQTGGLATLPSLDDEDPEAAARFRDTSEDASRS